MMFYSRQAQPHGGLQGLPVTYIWIQIRTGWSGVGGEAHSRELSITRLQKQSVGQQQAEQCQHKELDFISGKLDNFPHHSSKAHCSRYHFRRRYTMFKCAFKCAFKYAFKCVLVCLSVGLSVHFCETC